MVVVQALVQALAWTLHTAPHPTLYTPSRPTLLTPPGRSVGLIRAAELVRGAPPFGELLEDSIYPEWPEAAVRGKRELSTVLTSFVHVATSVPLDAASDPGEPSKRAIQAWLDGGFEAHKFIHRSISRGSYVEVLGCLQCVLAQCQAAYPDLWAVLQFVPKKNGLNPVLSLLAKKSSESHIVKNASRNKKSFDRCRQPKKTISWIKPVSSEHTADPAAVFSRAANRS